VHRRRGGGARGKAPTRRPRRQHRTGAAGVKPAVGRLLEATRLLAGLRDPAQVLEQTATLAARLVGADRAVVAELEGDRLTPRAVVRVRASDEGWRPLLEKSITAAAPVVSGRAAAAKTGHGPVRGGRAMAVPLRRGEVVLGGVFVEREPGGGNFTAGDLELLLILATQVATVLENARVTRQRELEAREKVATLDAVAAAVVSVTADGRVTAANSAAARLLGLAPEGLTTGAASPHLGFLQPNLEADAREGEARMVSIGDTDHLLNVRAVAAPSGGPASYVATILPVARVRRLALRLVGSVPRFSFAHVVGDSAAIRDALGRARTAALSGSNVLLTGESGTGKEVFAQAIHNAGARRDGPFVGLNCAAIPRELLETELFGYEGGAFTGAKRSGQPGKFELAEGGTLLLDEIGDMPLEMQAKLLRVLEERRVTRVGGMRAVPFDARLIATTNRDLGAAVAQGRFRQDLYFRLRVIRIELPPLRSRTEDIPALCRHFIALFCAHAGRPIPELSPEVITALEQHPWPGNIRELEHVLEAEVSLAAPGETVLRAVPEALQPRPVAAPAPAPPPPRAEPAPSGRSAVDEAVRGALVALLRETHGDTREVARRMGVSRATVYNKLIKYGLKAGEFAKA
jgi:sigma-54 dependent transcriptional regulator, acetoin dehydrogenase operon transcriptional activator AcoR